MDIPRLPFVLGCTIVVTVQFVPWVYAAHGMLVWRKHPCQHVFTAAAINLIRLDAFLEGTKATKTRTSRLAAFVPVEIAG
jgi:hypothetical protein